MLKAIYRSKPKRGASQLPLKTKTMEKIKEHLLKAGVKNLIEFGYEHVNTDNIMTDDVYKEMFKSMLEDNFGYSEKIDKAIKELLTEIN
jgi:small-conductance mechanosensitive channel